MDNGNHRCCYRYLYVRYSLILLSAKGNPDDTAIGCQCAECLFGFDDAGIYLCANQDAAVGKTATRW